MLSRFVNRQVFSCKKVPAVLSYFNRAQSTSNENSAPIIPRRIRQEFPDPVRYGFIPEEWFTFFYPKTGVTGPYMFFTAVATYLVSKEIYVIEHEFYSGLSLAMVTILLIKKVGPIAAKIADKEIDDEENFLENEKKDAIATAEKHIVDLKHEVWRADGLKLIMDARRANIGVQLEITYRERLQKLFDEVKNRLDFQVKLQNVERQFSQAHMVQWIVDNVKKGFTPDQEKLVLQKCISDLQGLVQKI